MNPLSFTDKLDEVMLADRQRLRQLLTRAAARQREGKPADRLLDRVTGEFEQALAQRKRRLERLPRPSFELDLPVVARRDEIAAAIRENQVVIVCGETGSGKTTQLPKICLEVGRGVDGLIGHTQPRRIAARTVAARIAEELGSPLSTDVGYKVRFGDHTGPDTFIKVMTDGILLAETQGDRQLEQYDTIIIDEAHERSLNIDFLLGFLKQLLPRRPELKIIVTSATIDPQRFARHFETGGRPAPIIEVSGRTYPVEVRYRPPESDDPDDREVNQEQGILAAVDELAGAGSGDILVFLSGERDIRQTAEALRKHHPTDTEILPLYARLSAAEQMRAFQPHRNRRILLATNVAETSLTVPGIRYVIDPGLARISRYSHRNKVQRLPIEPVSRASADQRKGRCGRVAEGICIRLYSEQDYLSRPQFTDPEILRTNLASVILQMKALRLGKVEEFPFVDPPDPRMVRDGYETLHELGAIDEAGELTALGRDLAKLPIEPRIGRMILEAAKRGGETVARGKAGGPASPPGKSVPRAVVRDCMAEVLVIAAALSIQDPRERPMAAQQAADQAHAPFKDEQSDFVALLNLWRAYHEQKRHLSHSKLRKWCRDTFLSYTRMREWEDIHQQLKALAGELGLAGTKRETRRNDGETRRGEQSRKLSRDDTADELPYDAIHRAVLAGLLSNVGMRDPQSFEYKAPRAGKYAIFPGSGLFKKAPRWVVAAEVVQTTRLYARMVAKIDPEWIEPLAMHLVKRSHFDPHWSRDTGQVLAFEKVSLWGLEIVARRRIHYGPVDPPKARQLFIHHALVEGESRLKAPFLEHNRRLIAEARSLEARTRRHDLVADNREIFAFYDARLPGDVYSVSTLEKWRRKAERNEPRLLFMAREDVLRGDAEVSREQYPDSIPAAGTRLNITYECDPGGPSDGITLVVPIEALASLDEHKPEWLVPGMLKDKIQALLRCLPKQYRKALDPIPALAEQCASELPFAEGSLFDALAAKLQELRHVRIPREAWQPRAIQDHLRMHFSVVDDRGRQLGESRDLAELKKRFEHRSRASFAKLVGDDFERDGIRDWDFGELPEQLKLDRPGLKLPGYPALVDRGDSVSLRLLDSAGSAAAATHAGIRRLLVLQSRSELDYQLRICANLQQMCLHYAPIGSADELKRALRDLIAERAFFGSHVPPTSVSPRVPALNQSQCHASPETPDLPRNKSQFDELLVSGTRRMSEVAKEVLPLVAQILATRHTISLFLADRIPPAWGPSIADIQQQLKLLLHPGFLLTTPWERLAHYPRYLAAIQVRLKRLQNAGLARDQRAMQELALWWQRYLHRAAGAHQPVPRGDPLEHYRWMLEEFRVSLFAQELGTAAPISAKRLEEQWGKVEQ